MAHTKEIMMNLVSRINGVVKEMVEQSEDLV